MKLFTRSILIFVILVQATDVTAGVIYDEAADGDLSSNWASGSTAVGNVFNGTNTIDGSSLYEKLDSRKNTPFTWDSDNFNFTLSDTATVTFKYTVSNFAGQLYYNAIEGNASSLNLDFRLFGANRTSSPANPGFINNVGNGSTYNIAPITLAAGVYEMQAEAANLGFGGSGSITWDYDWELSVTGLPSAVLEPSTFFLLMTGLASISLSRRKRNHR